MHPRRREENGRVVFGDEGRGRNDFMPALFKEIEIHTPQIFAGVFFHGLFHLVFRFLYIIYAAAQNVNCFCALRYGQIKYFRAAKRSRRLCVTPFDKLRAAEKAPQNVERTFQIPICPVPFRGKSRNSINRLSARSLPCPLRFNFLSAYSPLSNLSRHSPAPQALPAGRRSLPNPWRRAPPSAPLRSP